MAINAISYLTGNTAYQTGMFKRGPVGVNMSTNLTGNFKWWNKVSALSTQYLIYTDSYTTERTDQATAVPTCWATPDLTDQSLVNLINTIPERVGQTPFTTVTQAVNWLNQTNKYLLLKNEYENIVTSNLVLNLDAGWYDSYPASGTLWSDLSGNGYNGTLTNNPSFNSNDNGYIDFDGSDDFVDLGNVTALGFTNGIFTVEAWVYVPSTWTAGSQYPNLISKGASAGWDNAGWSLFVFRDWTGAGLYSWGCGIRNGGTALITQGNTNLTPNQFVHICATADGSNVRLYQNGVLMNTYNQTVNPEVNSQSVLIGKDWVNNYFPGNVAITRLYNAALTSTQVQQNFNAQAYRFGVNSNIVTSGLLLYLDANDRQSYPGTGTVWYDLSGKGANGNLINSPTWSSNGYFTFDSISDLVDGINVPQDYIDLHIQMYSDGGNGTGLEMVVSKYDDYDKSFRTAGGVFRHENNGGDANDWNYLNTQYDYVDGNFLTSNYNLTGDWHFVRLARANTTFDPPFVYSLSSNFLSRGFLGKIRKVLMYNRTLSPSEVAYNYYQGNIVTNNLQLLLDAGNIVSYHTTGTTIYDLTNNANNGSAPNGFTYNTTVGGNLYFDGVNQYFDVSPTTNIRLNGNYSTVSVWCYIRSVGPNSYAELYSVYGANRTAIKWQSNGIGMDANGDFYNVFVSTTNAYNEWMNITCVIDRVSSVFKVYKNGVYIGSDTFTTYTANSTSVAIGSITLTGNSGDYIKGSISNVSVYNTELDATQITQNFNAYKSRFGL